MIRFSRSLSSFLPLALLVVACGSGSSGDGGSTDGSSGGAGGSGGGASSPPERKSGTRLLVRYQTAGTAALPIGFFDQQLGEDCDTTASSDGTRRCLPGVIATQILYLDAACTQPAIPIGGTCAPPKYARLPATDDRCPVGQAVRPVTGKAPVGALFAKGQGCGPATVSADATIFALGDETPPAMFATVTRATSDPRGASLAVQTEVFDDGATATAAILDLTHGSAACTPLALDGATLRCVPSDLAGISPNNTLFTDASCSSPLALYPTCGAATPGAIVAVTAGACGTPTTLQLLAVGAPVTTAFSTGTGSCAAASGIAVPAYAAGAALPASSFPAVSSSNVGDGRIQLVRATGPAGELLLTAGLYDTKLATRCRARAVADGTIRCLPATTATTSLAPDTFSDAACTQAVLVLPQQGCDDSEGVPTELALSDFNACGPGALSKIWPVSGAPHQVDAIYSSGSGTCVMQGSGGLVLDLGAPSASFDDFAAVTIDP